MYSGPYRSKNEGFQGSVTFPLTLEHIKIILPHFASQTFEWLVLFEGLHSGTHHYLYYHLNRKNKNWSGIIYIKMWSLVFWSYLNQGTLKVLFPEDTRICRPLASPWIVCGLSMDSNHFLGMSSNKIWPEEETTELLGYEWHYSAMKALFC